MNKKKHGPNERRTGESGSSPPGVLPNDDREEFISQRTPDVTLEEGRSVEDNRASLSGDVEGQSGADDNEGSVLSRPTSATDDRFRDDAWDETVR